MGAQTLASAGGAVAPRSETARFQQSPLLCVMTPGLRRGHCRAGGRSGVKPTDGPGGDPGRVVRATVERGEAARHGQVGLPCASGEHELNSRPQCVGFNQGKFKARHGKSRRGR